MKHEVSVTINDSDFKTAGDLKELLKDVPDDAKPWISTHKGDYNYSDWHTIEFTWTVGK